jgi:hypothetical protein
MVILTEYIAPILELIDTSPKRYYKDYFAIKKKRME